MPLPIIDWKKLNHPKAVQTIPLNDYGYGEDISMPLEDKLTFGQPLVGKRDLSVKKVAELRQKLKE